MGSRAINGLTIVTLTVYVHAVPVLELLQLLTLLLDDQSLALDR